MIGHARGGENLLAADLALARQRHGRDAHAQRVRAGIRGVLDGGEDRRDVLAFHHAVGRSADEEHETGQRAGETRHAQMRERQRDAAHATAHQPAAGSRRPAPRL